MEKLFYSTTEVADLFKVNRVTIYRWIKDGKVAAFEIGKHFKIPAEEIKRLVRTFGISGELLHSIERRLERDGASLASGSVPGESDQKKLVVAVGTNPSFLSRIAATFETAPLAERCRLLTFSDSLAAALVIGSDRPELLLIDGESRELDGMELAVKIKAAFEKLKIVVLGTDLKGLSHKHREKLIDLEATVAGMPLCHESLPAVVSSCLEKDLALPAGIETSDKKSSGKRGYITGKQRRRRKVPCRQKRVSTEN